MSHRTTGITILHPTKRHPLTGLPLQAAGVLPNGRIVWPILGGDDTVDPAEPNDPAEPAAPTGDPDPEPSSPGSGDDYADLRAIVEELGLQPGQIAGRLIASKKWEKRAKGQSLDPENPADPGANDSTPDPVDPETLREQVRAEIQAEHESDLAETAIRGRLEGRGVEADAIENIVTTLTGGLRGVITEGRVDADKVNALVSLLAPSTQTWPDMGQGNRGAIGEATGLEAGRSAYERRRGKK